jgi:hypothetical protein
MEAGINFVEIYGEYLRDESLHIGIAKSIKVAWQHAIHQVQKVSDMVRQETIWSKCS